MNKILLFFAGIFFLSNLTNFIVRDVTFNSDIGLYFENYGELFGIFAFLYLFLIPLFVYVSIYKFKNLSSLNRTRLGIIIIGFLGFVILSLIYDVFIPYFTPDFLSFYSENLFPFFIIPFIFAVLFSSYKYDFSSYKVYLNHVLSYGASLLFTIIWLFIVHNIFMLYSHRKMESLFSMSEFKWGEIILAIIIFSIFFKIFRRFHLQNIIKDKILEIQQKLPFVSRNIDIDTLLKNEFYHELGIQDVKLLTDLGSKEEISRFFTQNKNVKYLVNDYVFFQNNKHKCDISLIQEELGNNFQLTYPLFHKTDKLVGLLLIGKKRLSDAYTTQEIKAFIDFSGFLEGYLKYISVYKKLEDISINLDKKVDEKTIEFNNLLNKQKEFIAYVGHEIKNPITNTLFLTDSIKHDTEGKVNGDIKEDIHILYDELVKISKLVKYIFSAEKFDLGKVELYKKDINAKIFLKSEITNFQLSYKHVNFITDIDSDINLHIDEIQFRQVITNLINNSLKFIHSDNPKIYISCKQNKQSTYIEIEDNGVGFSKEISENLFDKYMTGNSKASGLGMGLYLCKKILKLHGGDIQASIGDKHGGAKFTITI